MRSVTIIFWLLLVGVALATPRWGDDFEWIGDSYPNYHLNSLTANGDTLFCLTDYGFVALQEVAPDSFRQLTSLALPYYHHAGVPYLFRYGDKLTFTRPNPWIQWDGINSPTYLGPVPNGTQFQIDTTLCGNENFFQQPDVAMYDVFRYPLRPVRYGDYLFHLNRIFIRDSNDQWQDYLSVPTVSDWAVRNNIAFGADSTDSTFVILDLSQHPPSVRRVQVPVLPGVPAFVNDTLVTVGNNHQWIVWTLNDSLTPSVLDSITFPYNIKWLMPQTDRQYIDGMTARNANGSSGALNVQYMRFSLAQSVRYPVPFDSIPFYQFEPQTWDRGFTPPPPALVTRTQTSIIGAIAHEYPTGYGLNPHLFCIDDQTVIDTAWFYRTQTNVPKVAVTNGSYSVMRWRNRILGSMGGVRTSLQGGNWGVFEIDTNGTNHQILGILPNDVTNLDVVDSKLYDTTLLGTTADKKVLRARFTNGTVIIDTLLSYSANCADYFHITYFSNRHFVLNASPPPRTSAYLYFYRIDSDSARLETTINVNQVYNILAIRDSNAVFATSSSPATAKWFRLTGTGWVQQTGFSVPIASPGLLSSTNFDTLFVYGRGIYVLPQTGMPYLYCSLDTLFQQYNTEINIDLDGNILLVDLHNYWYGFKLVYQITPSGLVYRGRIMKQANPIIYHNTVVLFGNDAISTYHIPHYDTAVEPLIGNPLPNDFKLSIPYPNPFNSTLHIRFDVPKKDQVTIIVSDVLGRIVSTLHDGQLNAGRHEIIWHADRNSSGIYFISMKAPGFVATKKVVMVK